MNELHVWYGTGVLGAAFVERLCARGAEVVVWNRTHEKAVALEAFGARAVRDASEAARGATFVHMTLSDDDAVDGVIAKIIGRLAPATVTIDHSTVGPETTAARFAHMAAEGRPFLHAPVFASPLAARQGSGTMLVAGASAVFDRVRASLEMLVSDVWYLGTDPRGAAGMKLFGNEMLVANMAALADGLAIARTAGIDPHRALELFTHFKLQGAVQFRGKKMAERDYTPLFELRMARKDLRLMLDAARSADVSLTLVPALAERMDALIEQGHGESDLSVLAHDLPF